MGWKSSQDRTFLLIRSCCQGKAIVGLLFFNVVVVLPSPAEEAEFLYPDVH